MPGWPALGLVVVVVVIPAAPLAGAPALPLAGWPVLAMLPAVPPIVVLGPLALPSLVLLEHAAHASHASQQAPRS